MQLKKTAVAGTMESGGITLDLSSNVMQQFGRQIEAVIRETLAGLGVEHAEVSAVDKGALDCTVRARVSAAAFRAAERSDYQWEAK